MKVQNKSAQSLMDTRSLNSVKDGAKKSSSESKSPSSAEIAESTKLNLSPRAREINKAKEIAKQDSVDEAKIARLQAMIDKGDYKVDADAVAERLLDEHLTMRD